MGSSQLIESKTDLQTSASDDAGKDIRAENQTISEADRFHLLQVSRRRDVIRYLLEKDDSVRMSDLVRHVAASEYETSVTEVTDSQYQRVYIPLYQSHLPKLAECGAIEYDKSRGIIRSTSQLDVFRPYLEPQSSSDTNTQPTVGSTGDDERDVVDAYIIATGMSGCLLVAVTVGLLSIPGTALGTLIILIFLVANAIARRPIATAKSS